MDRHRRLLLVSVGLLYAAGINGQWRLGPDTAMHATIGQALSMGGGYEQLLGAAEGASPGLPYLLAVQFRLFGPHTMWPAVLFMSVLGLGIVFLTYRLMRLHANRAVAVFTACALGITATFYRHTLEVSTDLPFMAGLMLFLLGHERTQHSAGRAWVSYLLMACGLAAMAVFRFVVIVVVAAVVAGLLLHSVRQRRWSPLMLALLLVCCLLAVRLVDPRTASFGSLLLKKEHQAVTMITELPQTLAHAVTVNAPRTLFEVGPEGLLGNQLGADPINALFTVVAFAAGILLLRRRLLWGLLVGLFLLQWLLFLPDVRYFLPVLPLLIFAWWRAARWTLAVVPGRAGASVAIVMIGLWVAMNVGRTVGVVFDQRGMPFAEHYENGRYVGIEELGRALGRSTEPGSTILTAGKWHWPLWFYSGRRAVNPHMLPRTGDGPLYVVEPLGEDERRLVEQKQWRLAAPLVSVKRARGRPPLVARRVETRTGG